MSAKRTSLQARPSREDALGLRVAELSSLLKAQRDEIEEQKALLEHNRKITRDHEEIIRMQEAQLLERDAQIQAQNAEIRALRRQHAQDAEALRNAYTQLQGRIRPSGSMGIPRAVQQQQQREIGKALSPPSSPNRRSDPTTPKSTKRQLQQAIADKVSAPCPSYLISRSPLLTSVAASCAGRTRARAASADGRDGAGAS